MSELKALTALFESTRAIGLRDSLEELLEEVLEHAQRLVGFEHGAFMLYEQDEGILRVVAVRGYGDRAEHVLDLTLAPGQGLSGWAYANHQAVRCGDVSSDPRYIAGLYQAESNLAVPFSVQDEVVGVLNVESDAPHAFTAEHEKLLTVLGAQAALAIVAQRTRSALTQRVAQLGALHRISLLGNKGGNLTVTLNSILEITEEVLLEGHAAILLLDEELSVLRFEAGPGYSSEVKYIDIPLGNGVTGSCAATGEVVVVNDVTELKNDEYIVGVPGARSEIAVPMEVDGKLIGVLNAESPRAHAFSDMHVQTMTLIARQAAGIIRAARLQQETRRLAITDGLTGLYNRRHFSQQLEANISRAVRYDERFALILIDVDHFKSVNDRFGHLAGDLALQRIADVLTEALRDSDLTARIGGEEFAILLMRTDQTLATEIAERLRKRIEEVVVVQERGHEDFNLSASIGLAFFPDDGLDLKSLMRAADRALYRAKRLGRNRVEVAISGGEESTPSAIESM
ncbi:MAG: diguanylate cyclase [Gemmatimonadota bacterium]